MELFCEYYNFESVSSEETIYISRVIGFNRFASSGHVFNIQGKHLEGKSNKNVHTLIINGHQIEDFPRYLCHFYPNLKSISVISCGLKSLSRSDLSGCKGIQKLMLNGNFITSVASDVFDLVQNIETISFFKNRISFMPENVFDSLKKLKSIDMGNNPEIDFSFRQVKRGKNILEVTKENLKKSFGHKEEVVVDARAKFLSFAKALDYLLYFQDTERIAMENNHKTNMLMKRYKNFIAEF